jgi:F-box and WD-40 domain protein 1/11
MTRVFRMQEWAPSHESQSSTSEHDTPSQNSDEAEAKDSLSLFPFRKRLRSLPFGNDSDMADRFQNMSLDKHKENVPEESKREGGFRGLLRRASVSIKSKRQRRHSHATEERPTTASPWRHRLRQAASFNRHSRFGSLSFDTEGPVDSTETLSAPIPGIGSAPPIIPRGNGGDAARRTAAAQNEYFGRNRRLLPLENHLEDRESGIGIPVTMSEPTSYANITMSRVVGVDFINLLPVELSIQILAHLDHRDLSNTARASKGWCQVSRSPHVWREAFLREKSKTYATSRPVSPGTGLGLPPLKPDQDWKDLYRIREQLERNWRDGKAEPVYLNGHLDSIYCVQFDE